MKRFLAISVIFVVFFCLTTWDGSSQSSSYYDYIQQGLNFCKDKEYDKAEKTLIKAIKLKPDDKQAYSTLCMVYEVSERYQEAVEVCKILIRFEPNDIFRRMALGTNYFILRRYHEALEAYKQATHLEPESDRWFAYYHLGRTYNELNRHQEAEEAYKMAIRLSPGEYGNYYLLGILYVKMGNQEEALKQYKVLQAMGKTEVADTLYKSIYK